MDNLYLTKIDLLIPFQQQKGEFVQGIFHNGGSKDCVILISGAGGGFQGPMGMYRTLSDMLKQKKICALQLDFRKPSYLQECIDDVAVAIEYLQVNFKIERFGIVGWSFGGAVAITSTVLQNCIIGVATIASQTFGTDLVGEVAPKPILLMHGTKDTCLSHSCTKDLYKRARHPKEKVLFKKDDHALSRNNQAAMMKLYEFFLSLFSGEQAS